MSLRSLLHDLQREHPDFWDWFKFAAFTGLPAWGLTSSLAAFVKGYPLAEWVMLWIVISAGGDLFRYGLVRLFKVNRRAPKDLPGGLEPGREPDTLHQPALPREAPVHLHHDVLQLPVVSLHGGRDEEPQAIADEKV